MNQANHMTFHVKHESNEQGHVSRETTAGAQ